MNITIVEAPRTTALVTLSRMRQELRLTNTAQDDRLTNLIEEASAQIITYLGWPLIRQTVTERQVGYGRSVQVLSVTPVPAAGVTQVLNRETVVSGYSVSNPEAGFVYLEDRWPDTRPMNQWIEQDPAIMPGRQDLAFTYSGGYLLPGDNIVASGSCVASAVDNSFELVDGVTFWPILVSGEGVTVTGFSNAGNNGKFTVLARTLTKLSVSRVLPGNMVTESGSYVAIQCQTLPKDIEGLAAREVRSRFMSQYRDPTIKSESLGDWSASYGGVEDATEETGGLTPSVARGLAKYVRVE
jgi:hypothetical protein